METRKLVQSGLGSFVLSVPKDWLDRHSLGKGNTIHIERLGDNLLLLPSRGRQQHAPKQLVLNMDESVNRITRKLITSYIEGCQEVLIRGPRNVEKDTVICDQIEHLAGFEIVEKSSDRMLVQDLLRMESISLIDTFRKMDTTLRMMFSEVCEAIQHGMEKPQIFQQEDKIINKLLYTIARIIRAILQNELIHHGIDDFYQVLLLHELSNALEELGDHLKYLAREAKGVPRQVQNEVADIAKQLLTEYLMLMDAYHKRNREAAYGFLEEKDALHARCVKLLGKRHSPEIVMLSRRLRTMLVTLSQIAKIVRYR